jgi:hypothetical protein
LGRSHWTAGATWPSPWGSPALRLGVLSLFIPFRTWQLRIPGNGSTQDLGLIYTTGRCLARSAYRYFLQMSCMRCQRRPDWSQPLAPWRDLATASGPSSPVAAGFWIAEVLARAMSGVEPTEGTISEGVGRDRGAYAPTTARTQTRGPMLPIGKEVIAVSLSMSPVRGRIADKGKRDPVQRVSCRSTFHNPTSKPSTCTHSVSKEAREEMGEEDLERLLYKRRLSPTCHHHGATTAATSLIYID